MAYFLYLNSNMEGKLVRRKIQDGFVDIDNKKFLIDTSAPIILNRTPMSSIPLYIVKWDKIKPSDNLNPPLSRLKKIYPEFAKEKYDISPEMMRKMMGLKILGNMIKVPKAMGGIIMIMIGLIVGALVMYSMLIFGLLG